MSLQRELAAREREACAQVLLLQSAQQAPEEGWRSEPAQVQHTETPISIASHVPPYASARPHWMPRMVLIASAAISPLWPQAQIHGLRLELPLSAHKHAAADGYCFTHAPNIFSLVCHAGHQYGCHHCRCRTGWSACSQLGSCSTARAPCRACTGQGAEQQHPKEALHAQAQVAAGSHRSCCGRRYRRGELYFGPGVGKT